MLYLFLQLTCHILQLQCLPKFHLSAAVRIFASNLMAKLGISDYRVCRMSVICMNLSLIRLLIADTGKKESLKRKMAKYKRMTTIAQYVEKLPPGIQKAVKDFAELLLGKKLKKAESA